MIADSESSEMQGVPYFWFCVYIHRLKEQISTTPAPLNFILTDIVSIQSEKEREREDVRERERENSNKQEKHNVIQGCCQNL